MSASDFKHRILLVGIFLMSCVDAVMTLMWIKLHIGEEFNPILARALEFGPSYFVLSKILLTFSGCLTLYLCRKYSKAQKGALALFIFYFLLILYHCVGSAVTLLNQ